MMFLSPGDAEGETSEKLEFDDPLNENAMFLRSQGLQNEAKMVPKRAREEEKRQRRSEKRAEKRQKCSPERLGSALGRRPSISGVPGGGSVERTAPLGEPSRTCVSEGLGPKSEEKCCNVARFRDLAISSIFASQ